LRQEVLGKLSVTTPLDSGGLERGFAEPLAFFKRVEARIVMPVAPDAFRKVRRLIDCRPFFPELSIPASKRSPDQTKEALSTFLRPTRASQPA